MRELIRLVSSAGTGHFYTTDKNKRTTPDKIEIKKFDPRVRKHVIYKEAKIKYLIFLLYNEGPYLTIRAFFVAHAKANLSMSGGRQRQPLRLKTSS